MHPMQLTSGKDHSVMDVFKVLGSNSNCYFLALWSKVVTNNSVSSLWKWKWKSLSHVWLFATPRTIQSMEFSRPEYWSGWPFPSPGDLPNPGIKPRSPALQEDSLPAEPQEKTFFTINKDDNSPQNCCEESYVRWKVKVKC